MLPAFGQGTRTPYARAELSSSHLVPGEQSILIVRMYGGKPDTRPSTPQVEGTAINFIRSSSQINAQRQLTTIFLYRVTPVKPGSFTIPPIALRSRGVTYRTPPTPYQVHPLDTLITLPSGIGKHNILAGWFPEKTTLYQGEKCPISLKLYLPLQLPVALNGWGLPTPAKENCLAWRFSLPQTHETTQVTIDGISYQSATFDTTLRGIHPGQATFGPAPLRIMVRQSILDPLRGSRLINTPIHLNIPSIPFQIQKLPNGAPDTFNGAVGTFTIETSCNNTTLRENDTAEVIIHIHGRGNLESLRAPVPDGDSWKIIDSSKSSRGEERRHIEGTVTFRELLRPTSPSTQAIPPYSLTYFNPTDQSYHTISTPPIPVHITPVVKQPKHNNSATDKPGHPPEEMRGILGFIHHPDTTRSHSRFQWFPTPFWHIIPALIALLIITTPVRRKIKALWVKHPNTIQQNEELKNILRSNDQRTFYRKVGYFIEQWLPQYKEDKQLQDILTKRDSICFRENDESLPTMDPKKKRDIVALLKRCAKLTLLILLTFLIQLPKTASATPTTSATTSTTPPPTPPQTPQDAWTSGNYQDAIQAYQKIYPDPTNTPADILYNIGNCHYRLNQPGMAALAWRRALQTNPLHKRARQNLRFLELHQHALVPNYESWQYHLTLVSPQTYQTVFQASLWVFALSLLTITILRPQGFKMMLCITFLVLSPVLATLSALAIHWYPDDHLFAPIDTQAVTVEKTQLFSEANHLEKNPRDIPAASLLHIHATRGAWTYVITPDGHLGWVPSQDIRPIIFHPR